MNALTAKTAALSTAQLRDVIANLWSDFREEAATVFDAALVELERRLPEGEFVAFCETLSQQAAARNFAAEETAQAAVLYYRLA